MADYLSDRKYSTTHEWVKSEADLALIGISDYAQHELGDLVYAEVVAPGTVLAAGDIFGSVESVKAASDLYSPISGEVVEVWAEIEDQPEEINDDAFARWLIKVKPSDPEELATLMDADKYQAFCAEA